MTRKNSQKKNKNNLILFLFLFVIIAGAVFFIWYQQRNPMQKLIREQATQKAPDYIQKNKKAIFIIAFDGFRDEEYFKTQEVLFKNDIITKVASVKKGEAHGADGGVVNVDFTLEELKVDDYDAVVFIGGPGALEDLDNENSYRIAREAVEKNKLLAAICISPTILAKAGVLNGKRATVWASALDRQPIKILEENGADYVDEKVVQDGRIITANGPAAAQQFGEKIVEALK